MISTPRERYKILTAFVLPRPIGWVTTIGPTGVVNAAPFSFFNVFCEDPPLCMFAVEPQPNGQRQGHARSTSSGPASSWLTSTDEPLAKAMHESCGDFPPDIGEPDYLRPEARAVEHDRGAAACRYALGDGVQDSGR